MRKILIIILFILLNKVYIGQENNNQTFDGRNQTFPYKDNKILLDDSLKVDVKKNHFKMGILTGFHSSNLNKNDLSFNRGLFLKIYLKYQLSSEVHSIIGFSYWKANIKEIITPEVKLPSESVTSMGLNLELDFSLIGTNNYFLSLAPIIIIENVNKSASPVFSFGSSLKLTLHVFESMNILSVVSYQVGSEALNFGGGTNYSFFKYLLGFEIDITSLLNKG